MSISTPNQTRFHSRTLSVFQDLFFSICSWRIWTSLAMQDIRLRYRGSTLGPFWITLSTAITVYSMGFLYGALFHIDRESYLPFFATGMIVWSFISMIVNESTRIYLESKSYMENLQIPSTVYIFRLIFRNVIVFAHNIVVYFSLLLLYPIDVGLNLLFIIPGLFILCLNGIFFGSVIGMVSTKFADFGALFLNILQVCFFITPIMWMPGNLPPRYQFILTWNPFLYFVNLLRKPLLGQSFDSSEVLALGLITVLGMLLYVWVTGKYRSRVVFWL